MNYQIIYIFLLIIIACTTPSQTDEKEILTKAYERIKEFAKHYGWGHLVAENFADSIIIFDSKEKFDKALIELTGTDPSFDIPETFSAVLEKRTILAVSPRLYAKNYPEGIEEESYNKLIAHEMAHRFHIRILNGNEDAMGPIWFFEGFAIFVADQFKNSFLKLTDDEIWGIVQSKERGSYEKYAYIFRYFVQKEPLQKLVDKAGDDDFIYWLRKIDGKTGSYVFEEVYNEFTRSIIDSNVENFNEYISPEYGLYIIESAGAMPQMVNVKDISAFRGLNDKRSFFGFDKTRLDCELKEEELPVVDCDSPDGFYTKSGCYTQAVNTFEEEKIWMYCNLQAQQEEMVVIAAGTITRTVINTDNYRYYFSLLKGRWYITFIDLRIPCTA